MTSACKLIKEAGLKPSDHPTMRKNLALTEVFLTDLYKAKPSSPQKRRLKSLRLGRYVARRCGFNRGKLAIKSRTQSGRLQESTKRRESIVSWLKRPDNSTCLPGKRDFKKVGRDRRQQHILKDYLRNLHQKFLAENPSSNVSLSFFCKCQPAEVRTIKHAKRLSCLCLKHTNFGLKVKALLKHAPIKCTTPDDFLANYTKKQTKEIINEVSEPISYSEWQRVDCGFGQKKTTLVTVETMASEFSNIMADAYTTFQYHHILVHHRYQMVRFLKNHLNSESATIQMDFAENFLSSQAEEIQSAYFMKNSITLHPLVVHYIGGNGE